MGRLSPPPGLRCYLVALKKMPPPTPQHPATTMDTPTSAYPRKLDRLQMAAIDQTSDSYRRTILIVTTVLLPHTTSHLRSWVRFPFRDSPTQMKLRSIAVIFAGQVFGKPRPYRALSTTCYPFPFGKRLR
jgi:hypothetical protein